MNDDLTIPRFQLNPATLFPGADGISGTADDVRPFNNFLQQQTMLNKYGMPLWITPNAVIDSLSSTISVSGNSVTVNACFSNDGDAAIGSPVYVTLYSDSLLTNVIATDSALVQVGPGGSECVSVTVSDGSIYSGMQKIFVRINDRNGIFPYQPECDETDNVMSFVNPLAMRKDATLMTTPVFPHNGTYPNPVSVLYNEEIRYDIRAVNANHFSGIIIVTDTIPANLKYVPGSAMPINGTTLIDSLSVNTSNVLQWEFINVAPRDTVYASFRATPVNGAAASQPLFINRAWVNLDGLLIPTNSTFHQGAGISITTFSAGFGGNIYNAGEQALDYMTSPRSGVVIVPDDGYRFAG